MTNIFALRFGVDRGGAVNNAAEKVLSAGVGAIRLGSPPQAANARASSTRRLENGDQQSKIFVSSVISAENSTIGLPASVMKKLGLSQGNFVLVHGTNFETLLSVSNIGNVDHGGANLSYDVRNSLQVQSGCVITIQRYAAPRRVTRIAIIPFADTIKRFRGEIFEDLLQPYLLPSSAGELATGRPMTKGDIFHVRSLDEMQLVQFKIVDMEVVGGQFAHGVLDGETIVHCQGEPIRREDVADDGRHNEPTVVMSVSEFNALTGCI